MIEATSTAPTEGIQPKSSETFISLPAVKKLVIFAISSRVDPITKKLLPIEEEYVVTDTDGSLTPRPSNSRSDMIFPPAEPTRQPTPDGGFVYTSWLYDLPSAIYDGLIFRNNVQLTPADIDKLLECEQALEQTLNTNPRLTWKRHTDQVQDAYHVQKEDPPHSVSDVNIVSPLRVYINGAGILAANITDYVLTHGGDFSTIKTWVPLKTTAQQAVREDSPIFRVNTTEQLHSVIAILRTMTKENKFPPIDLKATSPLGIPISGIPGAYLIQMKNELSSPNSDMANFWTEPIREAAGSIPFPKDLTITSEWINNVATLALTIGKKNAARKGINSNSHALLAEQDEGIILDAIT